jgi:drug/metabolite transporter (DMT)-like permease
MGIRYILIAVAGWTLWCLASERLGNRFSPIENIFWSGVIYGLISAGGLIVHFREIHLPDPKGWCWLTTMCVTATIGSFAFFAAYRYLKPTAVVPLTHLYLVVTPLILWFQNPKSIDVRQMGGLILCMIGLLIFMVPVTRDSTAKAPMCELAAK